MQRARLTHLLFALGILAKGGDGVLEIAGGVALFVVEPSQVTHLVRGLTQHELSVDPGDAVARFLRNSVRHLVRDARTFAALYLLSHGVIKVGLVVALLRKHRWAYPAAIIAFVLFLLYQLYRYTHTHSLALIVLSVTDVIVILLTWLEYRRLRAIHAFAP